MDARKTHTLPFLLGFRRKRAQTHKKHKQRAGCLRHCAGAHGRDESGLPRCSNEDLSKRTATARHGVPRMGGVY